MVDEYKGFTEGFNLYAELSQHANEARENFNITPRGRNIVANQYENQAIKERILNINEPQNFAVMAEATFNRQKSKLEGLVDSDKKVKTMVDQMPKEDFQIGSEVAPVMDEYHGKKSTLYNELGKLKSSLKEYSVIYANEDLKKMALVVKDKILPGLVEKDKEAYDFLSKIDNQLDQALFINLYNTTNKDYAEKVKGNEKDFLVASLDSSNFLEFYLNVMNGKAQAQRNSEEQGNSRGRANYRMGGNTRRRAA